MRDLDRQFGISNLAGDFNRNFFDRDQLICSKNWFFRKIDIRKIGDIFAKNYSEKSPDHQSSSKNPVVSKNWRSNYRGSTVHMLNVVVRFIFSSVLKILYVEVRISQSILESPLEFEITRVDCMWTAETKNSLHMNVLWDLSKFRWFCKQWIPWL